MPTATLQYNNSLTPKQHDLMFQKAVSVFEEVALVEKNATKRRAARPTQEGWAACRQIIVHWDQSISDAARASLKPADYEELEKAVLYGDAMDQQMTRALSAFPKTFHMAMLPDCSELSISVEVAQEMDEADQALWKAKLRKFELQLREDQGILKKVHFGSTILQDVLDWMDLEHCRAQCQRAENLVKQWLNLYYPCLQR